VAAHAAHAPALAVLWRARDFGDNTLDLLLWNRRLASATGLVVETVEAMCREARRPVDTVGIDVFNRLATLSIFNPSRRNRMMFARKRSRCALVGAFALRCNSARTSSLAVITLTGRAIPQPPACLQQSDLFKLICETER